jgi:hypothetical protein
MDHAINYIVNYISDRVEEKHPYFDIEDEYDEFLSDDDIKNHLIKTIKSNYSFFVINEIKIDDLNSDHICTIEIMHNDVSYRFIIRIYICSRGYKYLHVMIE